MIQTAHEKICIITGATSGIGRSLVLQLAKKGWTIGIICRNEQRGQQLLHVAKSAHPESKIDLFLGDLSSQDQIHSVCAAISQKYSHIHALIHNAGVISPKRQITADGIELTLAVNHLASFLITSLLMPLLRSQPSKIILVTSRAEELAKIQFDDLQGERKYHWAAAYGQSKLANLLFAYELARREKEHQVSISALHPGLTHSQLGRHLTGIFKYLPVILRPFMQSADKAATFLEKLLELPCSAEPQYFIKSKLARSSHRSYDADLSSKLWTISETLTQGMQ